MKILLVSKMYAPDVGGVETVVRQYTSFAKQNGALVEVLACHGARHWTSTDDRVDDVRVHRCASLGTFRSLPLSPSLLTQLARRMDEFDIVHLHEPFPLGSLALSVLHCRAALVVTWHSDIIRQKLLRALVEPLQRRVLRRASVITTTSQALAETSRVLGEVAEKVHILPLSIPVDTRVASGIDVRPEGGSPFALFLGRDSYYKGVDVLIQALPLLRGSGYKVVFAGQAGEAQRVRAAAHAYPDRVQVTGALTETDKQALLSRCSVLVFPSTHASEAFGIVQLEAMALGKPVINTRLSTGVPWVSVDGVTGFTVPPEDPAALARAIDSLMADHELRHRYGLGAKARVLAQFTDEHAAMRLMEIYEIALRRASTLAQGT